MIAPNEFWLQLHQFALAYEAEGLTPEDRLQAILAQFRQMPLVVQKSLLVELLTVSENVRGLYPLAVAESIPSAPDHEVMQGLLEEAIEITEADMGNVQIVDDSGSLRIAAQRGFEAPFLDFFRSVRSNESACGAALGRGHRVIVADVTSSPIFSGTKALDVLLSAGVAAVQSTPLIGPTGQVIGIVSTHYRRPHQPTEFALVRLDQFAKRAVASLARSRAG